MGVAQVAMYLFKHGYADSREYRRAWYWFNAMPDYLQDDVIEYGKRYH